MTLFLETKPVHQLLYADIQPETPRDNSLPIVIFTGFASRPTAYQDFMTALAVHNRRSICVDAPFGIKTAAVDNYPRSTLKRVAAVTAVLDHLQLPAVDAIGYSQGAMDLAVAASINPDRFKQLILINPAGLVENDTLPAFLARFTNSGRQAVNQSLIVDNHASRKIVRTNPLAALKQAQALTYFKTAELLQELARNGKPITIIHTHQDLGFPAERVRKTFSRQLADSGVKLITLPGIHAEIFRRPAEYAGLIDQLLS